MLTPKIQTFIDGPDSFELIRDEIAAILTVESEGQQLKAAAASKNPELWKLDVYTESTHPLGKWLVDDPQDKTPIVNVWYDNDTADRSASNSIDQTKVRGTFNVDCYGYAVSRDDQLGVGHIPADKAAVLEAQRATRLARRILMSDSYHVLGLRGLVVGREHEARTSFQPQLEQRSVQNVQALRFALSVHFYEYGEQTPPVNIEFLSAQVKRAEDGKLLATVSYDFTT